MEQLVYVIDRGDSVAIDIPAPAAVAKGDYQSPQGALAVDASALPSSFRNAWRVENGTVAVNMVAARELFLDELRRMRDAQLAELDGQMLKAMEQFDEAEQAALAAEKQALRDLPQTVAVQTATNIDELVDLWPIGELGAVPAF